MFYIIYFVLSFGILKINVVPFPKILSTSIVPFIASISCLKFSAAPSGNAKNGIMITVAGARNFLISSSILPRINPAKIGTIVATKAINGISAIPVAPNANMVKKGPSLMDKIETAPTSVESPYSPAKAAKSPPLEFVKAGIEETNNILEERAKNPEIEEQRDTSKILSTKPFMLNTNYNNDKTAHVKMLENQEAAAFYSGWKEYICNLQEGDKVYLYQSGVGFVASGTVTGDLIKSEYDSKPDAKYSKRLKDFKVGFKAISAKEFKLLTDDGANFRMTMVQLSLKQRQALDNEINKRMNAINPK